MRKLKLSRDCINAAEAMYILDPLRRYHRDSAQERAAAKEVLCVAVKPLPARYRWDGWSTIMHLEGLAGIGSIPVMLFANIRGDSFCFSLLYFLSIRKHGLPFPA